MKQLNETILLLFVIIIISPVTAATVDDGDVFEYHFNTVFPVTYSYTTADADAACQLAIGSNHNLGYFVVSELDSNDDEIYTIHVNYGSSYTTGHTSSINNSRSAIFCGASNTVTHADYYFKVPEWLLNFTASKTSGSEPLNTTFTATGLGVKIDSTNPLVWNFGDGNTTTVTSNTASISHTYSSPGLFTVTAQNRISKNLDVRTKTKTDYISIPQGTFSGYPLNGSAPLTVAFTATNITNSTAMSWSFGDGNLTTSPAKSLSHVYQNPGTYTVRLDYYNLSGTPLSIQKNNYITVGAPNATATTYAVARDLYTGFAINGAQVNMYDVENTSWTNTTTTNGIGSITTLLGHKINIWGSAVGYQDDNLQNMPAVDGGYYSLLLKPSNLTTYNTTAGNLTLIVTVQDLQLPHPTIQGAEVTAAWGSQYASGTTNAAGNTFFTVPNNTAIHLSAFKSGYASGSSTHITGSANGGPTTETAIMYIGTDYVTPVPTVTLTTGPGGTIPQTVDPYPCVGDGSPEDTANCQRKQSSMAADLISYGPDLVQFFIMLTFIGGLLLITKR